MASPFKMKPKTPMMKALVGKQGNLPQHLQDKIKAAPETAKKGSPAKSYGTKAKSPVMKKNNPDIEKDVVLSTTQTERKRHRGGTDIVTKETSERGGKGLGTTMGDRRGVGRRQVKKYVKMKGTGMPGSKGTLTSTKVSGTKVDPKTGNTQMRRLDDGSKVVVEAAVKRETKKKGLVKPKPKGAKITRRALGAKEKTASQIKAKGATTSGKPSASTADLKKKETAGKSPARSYGSKKKSPMMKKGVKGLKMQRGKK